GVLVHEALEADVASTVHYDARNVELTPSLRPGTQPGLSPDDFHSSSDLRQGVAYVASTGPGERRVDIVIQHEEGVSTILRNSNRVQAPLIPARPDNLMPNINNHPAPPSTPLSSGSTLLPSMPR